VGETKKEKPTVSIAISRKLSEITYTLAYLNYYDWWHYVLSEDELGIVSLLPEWH
jgi:hypothetical protein